MFKHLKRVLWQEVTDSTLPEHGPRKLAWERVTAILLGCAILSMGFMAWAQAIHHVPPFETPPAEQARVQGYVDKWMKQLNMQGWTVTMKVLPEDEIGTGLAGWSRTEPRVKNSLMLVCRGLDYPKLNDNQSLFYEQENTVVHELIHALLLYSNPENAPIDRVKNEQVTNQLANAFVPVVK